MPVKWVGARQAPAPLHNQEYEILSMDSFLVPTSGGCLGARFRGTLALHKAQICSNVVRPLTTFCSLSSLPRSADPTVCYMHSFVLPTLWPARPLRSLWALLLSKPLRRTSYRNHYGPLPVEIDNFAPPQLHATCTKPSSFFFCRRYLSCTISP